MVQNNFSEKKKKNDYKKKVLILYYFEYGIKICFYNVVLYLLKLIFMFREHAIVGIIIIIYYIHSFYFCKSLQFY